MASDDTYLITGATGNLGRAVLHHLLKLVPASSITVTSSSASSSSSFTPLGVSFRTADFSSPESLRAAFDGITKLFFVSSPTFDTSLRNTQHSNVITIAKEVGIKHIYYSSLAIGGLGHSDSAVMAAHLETERMLKNSGVGYTSIRMGCYIEAFPLFLNWYPSESKQVVKLPGEGAIAWATIPELGEATAEFMVRGEEEENVVLFAGTKAGSFLEIIEGINQTTGREVTLEIVPFEEYVQKNFENDEGGKPEGMFRIWGQTYADVQAGACADTSLILKRYLGREPKDGVTWIKEIMAQEPNYRWHQNYAVDGKKLCERSMKVAGLA